MTQDHPGQLMTLTIMCAICGCPDEPGAHAAAVELPFVKQIIALFACRACQGHLQEVLHADGWVPLTPVLLREARIHGRDPVTYAIAEARKISSSARHLEATPAAPDHSAADAAFLRHIDDRKDET